MLYVMLVGAYPFERPEDKHDNQKLQKMIQVPMPHLGCLLFCRQLQDVVLCKARTHDLKLLCCAEDTAG